MFNLEAFQDYSELQPLVSKLNKYFDKNKTNKVRKIIDELETLLEEQEFLVPITFILSVIAENYPEFISENVIEKIKSHIISENKKLQLNSIIIFGFYLIEHPNLIKTNFANFVNLLIDESEDVRDNAHYFLNEFIYEDPDMINPHLDTIHSSLKLENKKDNQLSLLTLLKLGKDFDFKFLFNFRKTLKDLIQNYFQDTEIMDNLVELIKDIYTSIGKMNYDKMQLKECIDLLDNHFIMKKQNFSKIAKQHNYNLKAYIKSFKSTRLKEKEIYFYIKNEKNITYFYELDKEKFLQVFNKESKISKDELRNIFSQIVESNSELDLIISFLLRLGIVKGHLSEFFYYPYTSLKKQITEKFQTKGIVNIKKNFDFLPPNLVHEIIIDSNQEFFIGKNKQIYYSLKKINNQIIRAAAKNSTINLRAYQNKLLDTDFIKLIKNLPKEYLTHFHKGTTWLTNIGKTKIETEINNAKIIGFLDISKISTKLKINKLLLIDIILTQIDERSGVWDNKREIFYFSKYLKNKIDEISLISDEALKKERIDKISEQLDIDKNHILKKIDENLKSIGQEILNKDEINIDEYVDKTGMTYNVFMSFINDLEINYFKKGNQLILNPKNIEEAKNSIKLTLLEQSKSAETISLGNFDINTNLIKNQLISFFKVIYF
jgi:hypothetical protein